VTCCLSTADPPFNGDRYSNLIKLAKISFAGDLLFGGVAHQEQLLKCVAADLIIDPAAFGVECALFAIEGARLLKAQNLSLVGLEKSLREEDETDEVQVLSYDKHNADVTAMHLVANSWASCARAAVSA
jgi:hypothetical protein